MNKKKKALIAGLGLLLAAGVAMGAYIGPRNVIGMIRYDQRDEGRLSPGDKAPDVELIGLSGDGREKLSAYIGDKPLVLIFGSFT